MKVPKKIEGNKFTLRKAKISDASSVAENINNKKIYNNTLRIPYPYTLKDAKRWIGENIREQRKKKKTKINFLIDVDGEAVGSIGFSEIKEEHKAEIGYWLGEKYWGQGIMTEAIALAEKFAFKELKLRRITAGVFVFNKGSARVLEKNGYELEGVLRKDVKKDGKIFDAFLYSKIK